MSIDRGMDKEDVVHIHIKKNKIMLFAATWMDLEIVTLSEVRECEHGEPKKNDTNKLICKAETDSLT